MTKGGVIESITQCRNNAFCIVESRHVFNKSWHVLNLCIFFRFPAFLHLKLPCELQNVMKMTLKIANNWLSSDGYLLCKKSLISFKEMMCGIWHLMSKTASARFCRCSNKKSIVATGSWL